MQPHQYVLGAGITFLFLLAALPYLFGIARRRAFDQGKEIGLAERDATNFARVRDLCADLDEIAIQREAENRKHLTTIANLKRNIVELEERITSYTGLAVTRADYERLLGAAETLRLTQRTLNALKSQSQATRAGAQAEAIDELAMRIHAQLRTIPTNASTAGTAA
ncbi:hypothetical protein [Pseudomonas chlororaphis]|uniref:ATPase n=1 Tax=Pseudomonas chlororaphis TaxID=587753 RepID=A0AAX3G170_9PSED|nr:hypothetical protein [Pseudomonas chlororaphis]AZC35888.1 hypothetical protein C4K37_1486 [Pseudomonas chlororaphis subsp. piscium]AZC42433.1 hypothetical protein C4K36_1493 [Pseudomonas chlororaphis subsp. piscium]WDG74355.1 hypothetical protein PUP65_08345 [Pseudomonas chlororaphis]WDH28008.1 hypothetical protein PUP81_25960 [Pseudomonas chlororaphis]WDH72876.1 hypothetical protein PUP78_08345 [Pseudomonas chlororaphis]